MKIVSKNEGVLTFSGFHRPAIQVDLGEIVLLETEDAVGGQVKDGNTINGMGGGDDFLRP